MNEKETSPTLLTQDTIRIIIPQCCREGWDSCTHVPFRAKKRRANVGL